MSHIAARANKLLAELRALAMIMEEKKTELEDEQASYDKEMEDWTQESGQDEPDLVENEQDIDLLREQILDLGTILSGFEEISVALQDL